MSIGTVRTSSVPTPIQPLPGVAEDIDGLEAEGKSMDLVDRDRARLDAKRYLTELKKAVAGNRFYKVTADLKTIIITQEVSGVYGVPITFPYNVSVVKSLFLQLRAHDNNVARMLEFLRQNPTASNQFPPGDYKSVPTS